MRYPGRHLLHEPQRLVNRFRRADHADADDRSPGSIGPAVRNSITMDGRVQPSVVCHSPGCRFHKFVQLKDWDGGYLQ